MATLLIVMFMCLVSATVGYSVGRAGAPGNRAVLAKQDKRDLAALRQERHDINRLAVQHIATEPFAMIVLDRLQQTDNQKELS